MAVQADPLQVPREPVYVIAHVLGEKVHAPHVITKADAPNVYDWFETVVTVVVGGSHGSTIVSWMVVVLLGTATDPGDTAVTVSECTPACPGVELLTVIVLVAAA